MDAHIQYRIMMMVAYAWIYTSLMMGFYTMLTNASYEGDEGDVVMSYWETRLPGALMPATLRAMVTPLTTHEATQFLVHIDATSGYSLPTSNVAAFCEAARIRCPQSRYPQFELSEPDLPAHAADSVSSADERYAYYAKLFRKDPASEIAHEALETYRLLTQAASLREICARSFFREQQILVSGVRIRVTFENNNGANADEHRAFLPRKLASLFPLTSDGTKISSMLGVPKGSLQETINTCKVENSLAPKVRMCLTSIEDVADFVMSVMGPSTRPISVYDSIANASDAEFVGDVFHVLDVKILKADPDAPYVSCVDMEFPFRVFYCHYTTTRSKVFQATLQGEGGSIHQRIAVCHYDTSHWNPEHVAFIELKTKPGQSEVCHWLGRVSRKEQSGWVFLHAA